MKLFVAAKGLFGNFFWPGQIGQVDIRQVSFLTPVRPILSAASERQSRGVYLRLHIRRSRDGDTWLIDLAGQAVEQ